MKSLKRWSFLCCAAVLLAAASCLQAAERQTVLDKYVQAPDAHYRYELIDTAKHAEYTDFLVRMTSLQWRDATEVNQPVWKHWMRIYVPRKVSSTIGMLYITGKSTSEQVPEEETMLAQMATDSETVVTELYNIPNEPLTFMKDAFGPRTEDEIIAYTWKKFMETGDTTWPLRLPMTKAAVRAMDTVTAFAAGDAAGWHTVDRFFVLGASKRGWTTWTTAAADKRVIAIAPMVIDVLNVIPSFKHHYRSYGFWAPAVQSYEQEGLMEHLDDPAYEKLMEIEDPFSYRERLTMPKLLVNAAGDQFFLPDSSRFYFGQLPGENHLLYEANTDHSLRHSDAQQSIEAFYLSIVHGTKRPRLEWTFEADGSIRVHADHTPTSVTVWQATNEEHRDFRLEKIGPAYKATALTAETDGSYLARVEKPAKGWTAFFVEATFAGEGAAPLKFTTAVRVLPDVEPFTLPPGTK